MSTLVGDLEVSRQAAHVGRTSLPMRPVWVTGHQPAHRRLTGEDELSERAADCSRPRGGPIGHQSEAA